MLRFCFPERDPDNIDGEAGEEIEETSRGKRTRSSMKKHSKDTNFYVRIDPKDDVEKMKVVIHICLVIFIDQIFYISVFNLTCPITILFNQHLREFVRNIYHYVFIEY